MKQFILLTALITMVGFGFGTDTKILVDELEKNNAAQISVLDNIIFDTLDANTVPFMDNSKQLTSSSVNAIELGYLSGVTSFIQTQIDSKITDPAILTSQVVGILPIVNGGTGSLSQNFVDLTTVQSVAGEKTFSSDMFITSTGALQLSSGTTGQRPAGVAGKMRWNTTDTTFEGFDGSVWGAIGGSLTTPGSTTVNAITKWDVTDGSSIANSGVIIDGSNNVTGIADLSATELQLNGATNDASSLFDVSGTTAGTRPFTRVDETQRDAISTPATGLLVYNTDDNQLNIYNGVEWVGVGGSLDGTKLNTLEFSGNESAMTVSTAGTLRWGTVTSSGPTLMTYNDTTGEFTAAATCGTNLCTAVVTMSVISGSVSSFDIDLNSSLHVRTTSAASGYATVTGTIDISSGDVIELVTSNNLTTGATHQYVGIAIFKPESEGIDTVVQSPGSLKPIMFSATISSAGVVSNETGSFISGNCTNVNPSVCTFETAFGQTPTCNVTSGSSAGSGNGNFGNITAASTTSVSIQIQDHTGSTNTTSIAKSLICHGLE